MNDRRTRKIVDPRRYPNGQLRARGFHPPAKIATRHGTLPAELVTYHPCGAVHRIFPQNAEITAYWSEKDEAALAEPLTLDTPLGPLTAKILSVRLDPEGNLLGLTLQPGETVLVPTPVGTIAARHGLNFHPGGAPRSLEPARPTPVPTPAGDILAYDPDAVGVTGDLPSLIFSPEGRVIGVTTVLTEVRAILADGTHHAFAPETRESLCGLGERELVPMRLLFSADCLGVRMNPVGPEIRTPLSGARLEAVTRPSLPEAGLFVARCS